MIASYIMLWFGGGRAVRCNRLLVGVLRDPSPYHGCACKRRTITPE